MCGIAGIIEVKHPERITSERMTSMANAMIHRGPDDHGVLADAVAGVGLGHRRLSIVDLSSAGHQPMSTDDGLYTIVYNGEIYDFQKLRTSLEEKGYRFHSHTDTEVILNLYREKGVACLDDLRGMYAFAIYDRPNRRVFMARDRIGIKPLYYRWDAANGTFYLASEIKAILQNSEVPRQLNRQGLWDYLSMMSVPAPDTLFEGIHKLPAAHYGIFLLDGSFVTHRYWDLRVNSDETVSEEEWKHRMIDSLRESVRLRMVCDVPFGAFLSGGIDSTLNSVLMQEARGQALDTFTVGYQHDTEFNEMQYSRMVAKLYHMNPHEILIDENNLLGFLETMAYHQDEPIGDWVCFPLYHVSKLVRDSGVIVSQVGEGSDELFCGYPWYLMYLNIERYQKFVRFIPRWIRRSFYWLATKIPVIREKPTPLEMLRRLAEDEFVFHGGASVFGDDEKKRLFQGKTYEQTYRFVKEWLKELSSHSPITDMLQKMTYLEFKQRLPELLLMRVDKMTMAHSIESRVPFLDHRFVEKMMQIPTRLKIKNREPKYMLKKASEGIIPNEIIYREKKGFAAPIDKWLASGNVLKRFREIVYAPEIQALNLFDYRYIDSLFRAHVKGKKGYAVRIWLLVNFALWYNIFILQHPVPTYEKSSHPNL